MSTNINDYTIDELFDILSLDKYNINIEEINTKIKELENKMMNSKLDNSTVIFIEAIKEKIYSHISHSGFEKNVISYDKTSNIKSDLINTNNNKYFDRIIIDKILVIDTKFRDNYDEPSTNFNIVIPNPLKNVISMQLANIEIPNTWYAIDETIGNNFFHIRETDSDTWYKIDISSGSYYYEDLISSINTRIEQVFIDTSYSEFTNIKSSIDLSLNTNKNIPTGNGKVTIQLTNDISTNFDLDFFSIDPNVSIYKESDINNISKMFGWKLGFHNSNYDYYYNNTSFTGESTLDIRGPRYLYLLLEDYNKSIYNNYIPFSKNMSKLKNTIDIFARISINNTGAFSMYNENKFKVYGDKRSYDGPININRLNIKVIDEHGDILNLNNNNFSFTIKMETLNMN